MSLLPTDVASRKGSPIATGVLDYFPKALAEIAKVSLAGNIQHRLQDGGLHWDRSLSTDHADALIRHFLERGTLDSDGGMHSAKVCWRALAILELELEAAEGEMKPDTKPDTRRKAGTCICTPLNSPNRDCLIHGE
jgi:hypothetical protein